MENDESQPGRPVDPSLVQELPEELAERLRRLEAEAAALRAALSDQLRAPDPHLDRPLPRHQSATHVAPENLTSGDDIGIELGEVHEAERRWAESHPETPEPAAVDPKDEPDAAPRELTGAELDKIEKLIQRYRLELNRGNKDIARQYLKEAQDIGPRSSLVLEAMGDDALSRRQTKEAAQHYKASLEADPKNSSVDRKYANLIFDTQAKTAAFQGSGLETAASNRSATILSIILPGLGQFVTSQPAKGAGFLLVYVASVVWFLVTPNGLAGIAAMVSGRNDPKLNMVALIPLFIGLVTWLASMIDMNTKANRVQSAFSIHERPVPPENLPFE